MITQDSGDSEILNNSTRDSETGAFKITLHDGHVIQGGPVEGRPDFQIVSSWCEGVRQAIAAREEAKQQEAIARKRREREDIQGQPQEEEEPEPHREPAYDEEPLDPVEYAELQVDKWTVILHNLRDQAIELQAKLQEADRSYNQWSKIYETLNGADSNEE